MQIGADISVAEGDILIAGIMRGEESLVQRARKVEPRDFGIRQRVQGERRGAATEKICMAAFDLARARTTQDKANTHSLNHPVDFIEQFRNLLDFVNQNRGHLVRARQPSRLQFLSNHRRVLNTASVFIGQQKIEDHRIGETFPQKCALPRLPGAPQKARMSGAEAQINNSVIHDNRK